MRKGIKLEIADPEKAQEVLDLLSEPGATIYSVSKKAGVPYMSVKTLMARNFRQVEEKRAEEWGDLIPKLRDVAQRGLRRAAAVLESDDIPARDAKDAMIATGIAVEKSFLIEGRPSQISAVVHEHRHNFAGVGAALREALESRRPVIDGAIEAEVTGSE